MSERKKPDSSTAQLNELLVVEYAKIPMDDPVEVSDLARRVFAIIDPQSLSPGLVEHAAILELQQLARAICRRRFTEEEAAFENGRLFDFTLQSRYPSAPVEGVEEHLYLPVSAMRPEDFDYNIERLLAESAAKSAHADRLRTERDKRFGKKA
jgi:hypothetical protein